MNKKNQNHIELLEDLISIPSFSGKENKSADRIEYWFKENKIKCSRHKNNIYAFNKLSITCMISFIIVIIFVIPIIIHVIIVDHTVFY